MRERYLVDAIVENILSEIPSNSDVVRAILTGAGSTFGLDIKVYGAEGIKLVLDYPIGVPLEVAELRDLMAVTGMGSWFTFSLTIRRDGDVHTEFDYEKPEESALYWLDLAGDLKRHPRDKPPRWMLDAIEKQLDE
ncbi:hypothetical protein [Nocardia sp. CC227C]|uniref:hypothetical protein n=1 Tax=Nocardia sp. CC227C TaxID=3044562 RepID=UPI00278C2C8A|nr:hypothetical protein [Nocardia sp. CC227C]